MSSVNVCNVFSAFAASILLGTVFVMPDTSSMGRSTSDSATVQTMPPLSTDVYDRPAIGSALACWGQTSGRTPHPPHQGSSSDERFRLCASTSGWRRFREAADFGMDGSRRQEGDLVTGIRRLEPYILFLGRIGIGVCFVARRYSRAC